MKKPTIARAARTVERGMGPGDANVAQDQVARKRAEMLVEKQAELDGVLDKHDDMVRITSPLARGVLRPRRSARCFISNSL